jgi:hypothetical protein
MPKKTRKRKWAFDHNYTIVTNQYSIYLVTNQYLYLLTYEIIKLAVDYSIRIFAPFF